MQEVEEPQFSSESERDSPTKSEVLDNNEAKTSKLKIPMFKCKYCNKEFLLGSLKKHEDLCDSKKSYQNTEPTVADQTKINEKHISDNNKKTFDCKFCDKSYTQSHNLKYHIKNVHDTSDVLPPQIGNDKPEIEDDKKLCQIKGCDYDRKNT